MCGRCCGRHFASSHLKVALNFANDFCGVPCAHIFHNLNKFNFDEGNGWPLHRYNYVGYFKQLLQIKELKEEKKNTENV